MYRGDSILHTFPFPYDRLFQIMTSKPEYNPATDDDSDDRKVWCLYFFFLFFSFLFSGAKPCDPGWILDFLLTSAVSLPACWNVGLSVCSYLPQLGVWSLLKGHSIEHARRCLSVFITSCQVRTIKNCLL